MQNSFDTHIRIYEYVAHKLALALGVPSSDAILISAPSSSPSSSSLFHLSYAVGIEYVEDFVRFNADDFLGEKQKYADDDPLLIDLMRQMAFRFMISLDDNPQFATSAMSGTTRLISFDYADAFHLSALLPLAHQIQRGYHTTLEVFHRHENDALLDAYVDTIVNYNNLPEGFLSGLLADLRAVGIDPSFHRRYLDALSTAIKQIIG